MNDRSSRRNFLAAGLALPAAGMASTTVLKETSAAPALASTPTLRYRQVGKTGLKVTEVGFGCMVTSDPSVITRAADLGITYFDTARGYQGGNNEKMVGAALKGKRKDVVLVTKSNAKDAKTLREHLETSLRELGTDYVDIWHLHNRTKAEDIPDELIEEQQKAKKEGKIRFMGVSSHQGQPELIPWMIQKGAWDVVLTAYNFSLDKVMDDVVAKAHAAGLGVIAMKVMAGGFRSVKPGEGVYNTLKREGAMLAALKWALRTRNVDTTIPSITDMDQLDENLKAMAEPFTPADQKTLAAQLEHIRPLYCRTCGACEGTCAQGLPVASILRFLSYAEGYGQFALGRESFQELPAHQVSARCKDCSACTVECPHGVRVLERVSRAQEWFA